MNEPVAYDEKTPDSLYTMVWIMMFHINMFIATEEITQQLQKREAFKSVIARF